MSFRLLTPAACVLAITLFNANFLAQAPKAAPSYAKDVRPFFVTYCLECHNAKTYKAGLDLETYKALRDGSDRGAVLVPGKPDESPIVVLAESKKEPRMPPKKASRHPKPAEVAVLRAWVAAGAKDDSGAVKVSIPDIKPGSGAAAPVRALAYHPVGELLAAGKGSRLLLLNPQSGQVMAERKLSLGGEIIALA